MYKQCQTRFGYDVMSKLATVTDALSNEWTYTYDANYNLHDVTNPRAATRTYTYDAADRLTHIEDATDNVTELTYDAAGNLKRTVYATGARVLRNYLAGGLLSTLSLPAEETTWTLAYTSTNRLSSVQNQDSRGYSFGYNPIGWLARATDTFDEGVAGGFATTYAHDEAGRVTGIRASSDESTRAYSYDARGALEELILPSDTGSVHTTYDYEASGLVERLSLPDGSETAYGYDDAGRLASVLTTTGADDVLALAYTRDENGNVKSVGETRYIYDEVNRLSSWYDPSSDATTTYTYDANSNLASVSVDGSLTTSFAFDAADRISNTGFTYDDAGNMTSDSDLDYVYDSANRLVAARDASTEATIATYGYDSMNRRVSSTEGSATTYYHYDGATPNVIAETDGDGVTIASYAYDASGRLHSMVRAGEVYYYHLNAHGDVVALTDETGEVVNEYSYDPYGNPLSATETVANPYRYASYRFDEASGLYYCWNRYYDPATYRFITADLYPGELTDPVSMNAYAYCGGDPVNRVDPSGLAHTADSPGYLDINVTGAIGFGVSIGVQIAPDGLYAYVGPAGGSSGCSAMGSQSHAGEGWYLGGEGGAVFGGGLGTGLGPDLRHPSVSMPDSYRDFGDSPADQSTNWKLGGIAPGGSVDLVYVRRLLEW